jgi:hypothetical protein
MVGSSGLIWIQGTLRAGKRAGGRRGSREGRISGPRRILIDPGKWSRPVGTRMKAGVATTIRTEMKEIVGTEEKEAIEAEKEATVATGAVIEADNGDNTDPETTAGTSPTDNSADNAEATTKAGSHVKTDNQKKDPNQRLKRTHKTKTIDLHELDF